MTMISIALILGLSVAAIFLLGRYWQKIVEWTKKAVEKIGQVLHLVVEGMKSFIVRVQDGFANKMYYYSKDKISGEWMATVYTEEVSESEIPPDILAMVKTAHIDVEVETTEQFREKLALVS